MLTIEQKPTNPGQEQKTYEIIKTILGQNKKRKRTKGPSALCQKD